LVRWSVHRGSYLPPVSSTQIGHTISLADDDPSIQAYRSLHYLLNVSESKTQAPPAIGGCINMLVITGDRRNCPKLSIAGLDLLQVLSNSLEDAAIANEGDSQFTEEDRDSFWKKNWLPVIESVANASRLSVNPVSLTQLVLVVFEYISCIFVILIFSETSIKGAEKLTTSPLSLFFSLSRTFDNTHFLC